MSCNDVTRICCSPANYAASNDSAKNAVLILLCNLLGKYTPSQLWTIVQTGGTPDAENIMQEGQFCFDPRGGYFFPCNPLGPTVFQELVWMALFGDASVGTNNIVLQLWQHWRVDNPANRGTVGAVIRSTVDDSLILNMTLYNPNAGAKYLQLLPAGAVLGVTTPIGVFRIKAGETLQLNAGHRSMRIGAGASAGGFAVTDDPTGGIFTGTPLFYQLFYVDGTYDY
jgi:hypothetical protein